MKMQPDRLEDLIAANALYRPGPMELIPLYCNRKHGREAVPQVHPIMDAILAETYGIMVYQEQVMQIFNQLGGIELSDAYKLIKAISKKTVDVIAKFQPEFIKGAMEKGVEQGQGGGDLRPDPEVRRLRLQQIALHALRDRRVPDRVHEDVSPRRIHGGAAHVRNGIDGQGGRVHRRMPADDAAGRVEGIKVLPPDVNISDKDFTPIYVEDGVEGRSDKDQEGRRHPLRHDGRARRGRESRRGDHRRTRKRREVHVAVRLLRARRSAAGAAIDDRSAGEMRRVFECQRETRAAACRCSNAPSRWASKRSTTSAAAR